MNSLILLLIRLVFRHYK